jgi:hypothetical protein
LTAPTVTEEPDAAQPSSLLEKYVERPRRRRSAVAVDGLTTDVDDFEHRSANQLHVA